MRLAALLLPLVLFGCGPPSVVYARTAPHSNEKFSLLLLAHTKTPAAQEGTRPAPWWQFSAERAATATVPLAICYGGDGDNDSHQSEAQMRAAAQRLAANPRVIVVAFYGASPKNWAKLRDKRGT